MRYVKTDATSQIVFCCALHWVRRQAATGVTAHARRISRLLPMHLAPLLLGYVHGHSRLRVLE